ncbi:MAG TPA: L-seryl-tRNA(Sec) selenium transferase [Candidatus Sulfotelmatobacter sp.]
MTVKTELFRKLPSVDEVARAGSLATLAALHGMPAVLDASRAVLEKLREQLADGLLDESTLDLAISGLGDAVDKELGRALRYSLRAVINATGVILHTNLGRAPLMQEAIEHIRRTTASYSNLEFDLHRGRRGKRDEHVDRLFRRLLANESSKQEASRDAMTADAKTEDVMTGEAMSREAMTGTQSPVSTIVVNNNAAAVLLALNTLADGGEVIVSRGELVEIGGSFRIPDVMAKSGAILREVGTTNRTRIADYELAISERTRLLLRVHRSNFEITGFTERASSRELAALSHKHGVPLMEDLGSGALLDLNSLGLSGEDNVLDSLRAGIAVVTYSGDKLLGGPQAGLISGNPALVARMRSNSLFRALRPDKLTLAALEATLLAYVKRDHDSIPAIHMMRLRKQDISQRAERLAAQVRDPRLQVELLDGDSMIGGGSAPSSMLPTKLVTVTCNGLNADELAGRLRQSDPPIIVRIEEGRVVIDLRTVFSEHDQFIAKAISRITG